MAIALAGFAQQKGDDLQADWPQSYETAGRIALSRETTPIFSPATVSATEQAIATYQGIVSNGGFTPVPGGELRIGSRSKAVQALRQRLIQSGDLDSVAGQGDSYNSSSKRAFNAFRCGTASARAAPSMKRLSTR